MERPVILLHGALGNAAQMQSLKDALHERGVVAETFGFPGHGSPETAPEPFDMVSLRDALLTYLAGLATSPYIFGYSMGGYAALSAIACGARVYGVTTLGTKFAWDAESAESEASRLDPGQIVLKVPAFAVQLASRFGERWPDLCRHTATMMRTLGSTPLLTRDILAGVSVPVDICRGELDKMVTEEESVWASTHCINGRFHTLPQIRHPWEMVPVDVIADFLCLKLR